MINSTFTVIFYIRRDRAHDDGKAPIYMRITIDGERAEISTKRYVKPNKWNSKVYRVKGRSERVKAINNYLTILHNRVLQAYNELLFATDIVTPKDVKDKVLGKDEARFKLLELFEQHNQKVKRLVGNDYAKATYKKFDRIYRFAKKYMEKNYDKSDLYFTEIDLDFIEGFEEYLKVQRGLQHNTTLKYISVLKKIFLIAKRKGLLIKDPFTDFDRSFKEKVPTHLTMKELKSIEQCNLGDIERLERVRDCFVFCCYTGLSYSDADKLSYDEFYEDDEGDVWLVQNRTKTDEPAQILLLPKALEIYKKYKTEGEQVLPTISNQRMNAYLKEIADVSRIQKNLTFHVARHTFATTITLGNGLSIETVQIMMGHRNRRSTEHYARITNKKLIADMKKLKNVIKNGY